MERTVYIWTWGNKRHKVCPRNVEHNFNVCNVTAGYKPHGVDLRKIDGTDKRLQEKVERGRNFEPYMNALVAKVRDEGVTKIGVNCHKGRHRSVAFAELAAVRLRSLGYSVVVEHIDR